jgi:hypothetical protein
MVVARKHIELVSKSSVSFVLFMTFSSDSLSVVWAHMLTCVPMRPHWLTTLGGAVYRFTGRTQTRHFVMAITPMSQAVGQRLARLS